MGIERITQTKIAYVKTVATAFLILSMFSMAFISTASAAGSITLTPNSQAPGGTVTVTGTGFGATKALGIGLGAEVPVTGESHPIPSPSGTGPFTATTNHPPIKPGSFSFHCTVSSDTNVVESDYTDKGDGTLATESTYALDPFVIYATGQFGRSTTSAWDGYTVVYATTYTGYQYNVTPAGNPSTSSSGTFTATITVPAGLANGNYNVTAIDTAGNRAFATLTVSNVVPEVLPVGTLMLLTMLAVAAGSWYFRKRPTVATNSPET
jgi:hypothetical protein